MNEDSGTEDRPLTLDEAIRTGVVDTKAIARTYTPETGVSVVDHDRREHLFFPGGWYVFRLWKREAYLLASMDVAPARARRLSRVQFRTVNTAGRVREPLLDRMSEDDERVARQFLIEQGLVEGPKPDDK